MMPYKILIVDDDENLLLSLKKILRLQDYAVDALANPNLVEKQLKTNQYHAILLDVKMPSLNGIQLLKNIMQKFISTPVIMVSGQSSIEVAMETIKEGAYDFIEKPIDPDRLLVTLKNALQHHELVESKEKIYQELLENFRMVGKSMALQHIYETIQKIASTNVKVLISGESGTGKELVAWAIHHNSQRQGKPYVKINCAAIPNDLLENELFGHKKGAFTGAIEDHKGKFLKADGGTLFLDEIGDMDFRLQSKLLRVLEENEVNLIGGARPIKVDVRVIAATNQNMGQLIKSGRFREDLFHRLNTIGIYIPPLRERTEDILPLAYHFLNQFRDAYNRQILRINRQAELFLLNHTWPGNIRELKNFMEKLVLFSDGNEITIDDIHKLTTMNNAFPYNKAIGFLNESVDLKTANELFEKNYILQALEKTNWHKSATAELLGIDRTNLFRKLKKHGII